MFLEPKYFARLFSFAILFFPGENERVLKKLRERVCARECADAW